jgi:hypothetical protein
MVKGVENGLRGFVPMSQLSYELSKVAFDHIWKCRKEWQQEDPGALWRLATYAACCHASPLSAICSGCHVPIIEDRHIGTPCDAGSYHRACTLSLCMPLCLAFARSRHRDCNLAAEAHYCPICGAHSIAGRTQEPMGLQIKWSNEGTALLVGKRFLVSHDDTVWKPYWRRSYAAPNREPCIVQPHGCSMTGSLLWGSEAADGQDLSWCNCAEQQGHKYEVTATQVAHACAGVHVEHQRRCHQPVAVQPAGAAADEGECQDAGEHAFPAGGAPQRGLVPVARLHRPAENASTTDASSIDLSSVCTKVMEVCQSNIGAVLEVRARPSEPAQRRVSQRQRLAPCSCACRHDSTSARHVTSHRDCHCAAHTSLQATIVRIVDYGAFAAFDVEVTAADGGTHVVEVFGLIHRKELSWGEVRLVEDVVQASSGFRVELKSSCVSRVAHRVSCTGFACAHVSRAATAIWRAGC